MLAQDLRDVIDRGECLDALDGVLPLLGANPVETRDADVGHQLEGPVEVKVETLHMFQHVSVVHHAVGVRVRDLVLSAEHETRLVDQRG